MHLRTDLTSVFIHACGATLLHHFLFPHTKTRRNALSRFYLNEETSRVEQRVIRSSTVNITKVGHFKIDLWDLSIVHLSFMFYTLVFSSGDMMVHLKKNWVQSSTTLQTWAGTTLIVTNPLSEQDLHTYIHTCRHYDASQPMSLKGILDYSGGRVSACDLSAHYLL